MPETVFLFLKLLSILFLAYCVLQSISGKPCSGCFRYCASPENLVYEIEEQDTQIDDAVFEDDHFYFLARSTTRQSPFITLCGYFSQPEIPLLFSRDYPCKLLTRAPPYCSLSDI